MGALISLIVNFIKAVLFISDVNAMEPGISNTVSRWEEFMDQLQKLVDDITG